MKVVKKHFKNQKKSIILFLKNVKIANSVSFYHKLRVNIKKLDALLKLLNFCEKDFKRTMLFKPFKILFKQTGKIRELQLEEEMLLGHSKKDDLIFYYQNLKKLKKENQLLFYKTVNEDFIKKIECFKKIKPYLKKISPKKVNSYLNDIRISIYKILNKKDLQVSKLHKLRIYLKTHGYTQKFLGVKPEDKVFVNKFILNILGEWHDLQVVIKHLNKAIISESTSDKEVSELEKIRLRIMAKNNLMYDKIKLLVSEKIIK